MFSLKSEGTIPCEYVYSPQTEVKTFHQTRQEKNNNNIIIIMQTYIAHWENMFYLLCFTMGFGSGKRFFEIKGF